MLNAYIYKTVEEIDVINKKFEDLGVFIKYIGIFYKIKDKVRVDTGNLLIITDQDNIDAYCEKYDCRIKEYNWKMFKYPREGCTSDIYIAGYKDKNWSKSQVYKSLVELLQELYSKNICDIIIPSGKENKKSYGFCTIRFKEDVDEHTKFLYKLALDYRMIDLNTPIYVNWKYQKKHENESKVKSVTTNPTENSDH